MGTTSRGVLKPHQRGVYNEFLVSGKLQTYLAQIDRDAQEMFDLTVKDIMTANPKTVRPETTLNEVDKILRKYNIHALVVTDKDGAVVGVIDSFRVI